MLINIGTEQGSGSSEIGVVEQTKRAAVEGSIFLSIYRHFHIDCFNFTFLRAGLCGSLYIPASFLSVYTKLIADAVFNPSGKKFHGEIKFKDLPPELKEAILYKLPNNFSLLERQMRIINRLHCAKGWCGYYECATDKNCSSSCTIIVNEDGSNEPVVTVKKQHTCASQISAMSLIDAKTDMIAMVKERAIVCSSDRAPVIAMDVWKHFANLHSGVRLLYLFC